MDRSGGCGGRTTTASPAIDPARVVELRSLTADADECDVFVIVARLFLDDAPARMAVMRDAARRADLRAIEREAHALKAASSVVGAMGMASACIDLEEVARSCGLAVALEVLGRLEAEFDRARTELATLPDS